MLRVKLKRKVNPKKKWGILWSGFFLYIFLIYIYFNCIGFGCNSVCYIIEYVGFMRYLTYSTFSIYPSIFWMPHTAVAISYFNSALNIMHRFISFWRTIIRVRSSCCWALWVNMSVLCLCPAFRVMKYLVWPKPLAPSLFLSAHFWFAIIGYWKLIDLPVKVQPY